MSRGQSVLGRWAQVLGVDNDDEAAWALLRLEERLELMHRSARNLAAMVQEAPDVEVSSAARSAVLDCGALFAAVAEVRKKFEAHLRGSSEKGGDR